MTQTSTPALKPDVLIFGGGIAGLWLINHLQHLGYQCLLVEKQALGNGQTLASQGIIHGGLKYALSGNLSGESESISTMPDRWRDALQGAGPVNLSGLPLLSDTQYLWSAGSMASRMTAFFASKMLRGRIQRLKPANYPAPLNDKAFKGRVYQLEDLVIDAEALIERLAQPVANRLLSLDPARDRLQWNEDGLEHITLAGTRIEPRLTVFCAGEGNQALLAQVQKQGLLTNEAVQLRPLKMLLVKHQLPPFYGHCIGASNKPQLTVTSHQTGDGEYAWYLGGDLAEKGVERTDEAQIVEGKALLDRLFPWINFTKAKFATLDINRAEPKQHQLVKPDNAYAKRDKQVMIAWPTKLTLAPDLADRVTKQLDAPASPPLEIPDDLPRAHPALARWHSCGWQTA